MSYGISYQTHIEQRMHETGFYDLEVFKDDDMVEHVLYHVI